MLKINLTMSQYIDFSVINYFITALKSRKQPFCGKKVSSFVRITEGVQVFESTVFLHDLKGAVFHTSRV